MRTAFALASILALGGCAVIVLPDGDMHYEGAFSTSTVQGNGQAAVERRDVVERAGLDINGPLQVEVRVGGASALQVEGDSNLLPLVHTEGAGDNLRIWVDGRIQTRSPLRVIYTTPRLTQINSSGSGRLTISGLNGGTLSVNQNGSRTTELSGNVSRLDLRLNGSGGVNATGLQSGSTQASVNGSGRLSLGQLRGDSFNLDVHGSGGVNASGAVRAMSVRLYGSGSADLGGLLSQGAELSTHGSGSISAGVSQSLVADTTGSGRITVYGNPAQRSISGKHVSVIQ